MGFLPRYPLSAMAYNSIETSPSKKVLKNKTRSTNAQQALDAFACLISDLLIELGLR